MSATRRGCTSRRCRGSATPGLARRALQSRPAGAGCDVDLGARRPRRPRRRGAGLRRVGAAIGSGARALAARRGERARGGRGSGGGGHRASARCAPDRCTARPTAGSGRHGRGRRGGDAGWRCSCWPAAGHRAVIAMRGAATVAADAAVADVPSHGRCRETRWCRRKCPPRRSRRNTDAPGRIRTSILLDDRPAQAELQGALRAGPSTSPSGRSRTARRWTSARASRDRAAA